MSQPKLTLRPPPNVDFVQGYPGIPPGPDRPQAAVKGAIEVRVGPQGVKAKWVRVELRKVETLPGGGVANTFFDFVGQSPVSLWQAPSDEYGVLHTNDFPFFIRIPDSIPPTLALEKGAGIKYELIASVCVQGKRGFFRRDKPTITATASPIIIDKHELHSTWPVYSQLETRTHSQDGVTLIIERAHTCYGPGDKVVVNATVKSDTLHTVTLRGLEFMLRETTVFRAAAHIQGKKGSPQVKVSSIGDQKVPVNATLYPGTQHKAELSVLVPDSHTSATINAARHIDINYVLTVKALMTEHVMSTEHSIVMDLPIMISNWPRPVSIEAMKRIGHAFNVSIPPGQAGHGQLVQSAPAQQSATIGGISVSPISVSGSSPGYSNLNDQKASITESHTIDRGGVAQYHTVPANAYKNADGLDDFGRKKSFEAGGGYAAQTIAASNNYRGRASSAASSSDGQYPAAPAARPRSSNGRGGTTAQRLTIANISEEEMKEHMEAEAELARRKPSVIVESPTMLSPVDQLSKPPTSAPQQQKFSSATLASKWGTSEYMSAEKEKELLYKRAVENVQRVQGRARSSVDQTSQNDHEDVGTSPAPASSKPQTQWLTAEEEKARLFEQARAAVARARGIESSELSPQTASSSSPVGRVTSMSTGAALYQEAMSAINRPVASPPANIVSPTPMRQPVIPSAQDEKAMLQRYYDAKQAVYQTQSAHYGRVPGNADPTPYDALYPNQQPASPAPSNSYPRDMSPSSSSQHPILSEKERLRKHFEAQDAAVAQSQQKPWQPAPPQDPYGSPPPNPYASSPGAPDPHFGTMGSPVPTGSPPPFASQQGPLSAFEEKEMLRRRFEQQDAAVSGGVPTPPPRSSQLLNGAGGRRPPPTPPLSPNITNGASMSGRPLTAAEEKARLKAMFDAEDRVAAAPSPLPAAVYSPYPSPPPSNHEPVLYSAPTPSAQQTHPSQLGIPPPLAPKPPQEYIEETREEDLRTTAKLQAIDADPVNALKADPDLASIAASDDEEEQGAESSPTDTDGRDNSFGPGALSMLAGRGSVSIPTSPAPGISRSSSVGPLGYEYNVPLAVPPPPPLPPKVLIE